MKPQQQKQQKTTTNTAKIEGKKYTTIIIEKKKRRFLKQKQWRGIEPITNDLYWLSFSDRSQLIAFQIIC